MTNPVLAVEPTQSSLSIQDSRKLIDSFLNAYISDKIGAARLQSHEYAKLWETVESVVSSGGKRLRPYLLLHAYAIYDSNTYQLVVPVAAAQELLHISMLMHDDIIDRDYERHGQPNIAGHYRSIYKKSVPRDDLDHYATSAALLAGDLLLSCAHQVINSALDITAVQRRIALEMLHDSIFTVVGGELSDIESTFTASEKIDPLHIAHYKTAIYSFVNPLVCGARLAGASKTDVELLTDYGVNCGIAFQLTDDLLGIFGDESKTGKSTLSDLQEGKGTYLIQQVKKSLRQADIVRFSELFGKRDLNHSQADELKSIIETCGAKQATIDKITAHVQKAKYALESIKCTNHATNQLNTLLTKVTQRES